MKRLDVQGLRAVAIIAVIFYHYGWLKNGFVGVDIFFVVSGYVITLLISREIENTKSFNLNSFFGRRIRRLLPAMSLTLFVVILLSILLESPSGAQQSTLKIALAGLVLSSNLMIPRVEGNYFDAVLSDNPLLHIWSLSVEEQFYILIPVIIYSVYKIQKVKNHNFTTKNLYALVKLVFISSFSFMLFSEIVNFKIFPFLTTDSLLFYSPLTRAWEFLLGSLAALEPKDSKWKQRKKQVVGSIGYFLVIAVLFLSIPSDNNLVLYAPIVCFGTFLVLKSNSVSFFGLKKVLENKYMVWIGDRSYSLYLLHWPILIYASDLSTNLFSRLTLLLLTTLAANVMFIHIENRFRLANSKYLRRIHKNTLFSFIFLISTLALAFFSYLGNQIGWGTDWALGSHVGIQRNCDVPPFNPDKCSWGRNSSYPTALVVGDSQAWAIADGVIAAGLSQKWNVTLASHNNCPFVAALDFEPGNYCRVWQKEVLSWIYSNKPSIIVVANADYNGTLNAQLAKATTILLREATSNVIWVLNPEPAPSQLVKKSVVAYRGSRNRVFKRSEEKLNKLSIISALKNLENISYLNPSDSLCTKKYCYATKEYHEFYTDENHLSVTGSKLFKNFFAKKMKLVIDSY